MAAKLKERDKAANGLRLSQKALNSLRASNLHPGFDYRAALRKLHTIYNYDQIAEFCRYKSKASIAKLISGKRVPSHPQGEMLYIMYFETFNEKPLSKSFQE